MNKGKNIAYLLNIAGKDDGHTNMVLYGDSERAFYWNDEAQSYVSCRCDDGIWHDKMGNVWSDSAVIHVDYKIPREPNNKLMLLSMTRNWKGRDGNEESFCEYENRLKTHCNR